MQILRNLFVRLFLFGMLVLMWSQRACAQSCVVSSQDLQIVDAKGHQVGEQIEIRAGTPDLLISSYTVQYGKKGLDMKEYRKMRLRALTDCENWVESQEKNIKLASAQKGGD